MTLVDLEGHLSYWSEDVLPLFRALIKSHDQLTKDDFTDDLEWSLKVISRNGFITRRPNIQHIQCTKALTTARRQWAIISTVVFNRKDCIIWCWARPVSDS